MLFQEQISRKPNLYSWTKDFSNALLHSRWTDDEFTFASDKQDFHNKLTDKEKEMIVRALSGIAQVELSVKQFWLKLGENLPHPTITDLGVVMAASEVVHTNAYERLLDELGLEDVFEENLELDWLKGRVDYLRKHAHRYYEGSKKQFLYSLVLFTLFVENVSLFSQFYVINWFGLKNLLKDTGQQTAYTAKEEDLHAKIGMKLINTLHLEYPELFDEEFEKKIIYECTQAFKAECSVIEWTVNGTKSEFLSSEILEAFVQNRFNESLIAIGFAPAFEPDEELLSKTEWFNVLMDGNNSTDFFHNRPVEYAKSNQSFNSEDLF